MPPLKALTSSDSQSSQVQDVEDNHANQILGQIAGDIGSQSDDVVTALQGIVTALDAKPSE
jgi:uncharacterized protein (DUF2126 family)